MTFHLLVVYTGRGGRYTGILVKIRYSFQYRGTVLQKFAYRNIKIHG